MITPESRRCFPVTMLRAVAPMALAMALLAEPASAQTVNWTGNTSTDWSTAANWDTLAVPGAANDTIIDANSGNQPVYSSGNNTTIGNLTIGNTSASGANTSLTIEHGGNISGNIVRISYGAGSTGSVLVTGANSTLNGFGGDQFQVSGPPYPSIEPGYNGTGYLSLINGGQVKGDVMVGKASNGNGTVLVDGDGSRVTLVRHFYAGNQGASNVSVTNGGNITGLDFIVEGPSSQTLVSGKGNSGNSSTINLTLLDTISGRLLIYGNVPGNETVTIENGGNIIAPGGATISGVNSSVLITDNGSALTTGYTSSLTLAPSLYGFWIGNGATLTVANGATLTSNKSTIAYNGTASVVVTDPGSVWNATSNLNINANGTLTLANGGAVSMTNGSIVTNGTLNLNSGSVLQVGGTHGGFNGTGNITFGGGTLQNTANGTSIGINTILAAGTGGAIMDTNGHDFTYSGNISGAGNLTKIGAGTLTLSFQKLWAGNGTLTVNAGTFNFGSVINQFTGNIVDNATLILGNMTGTYPGIISGTGNLTMSNSNVTLGGASNFTGNLTLNASFVTFAGDTSQFRANLVAGLFYFGQNFDTVFPGDISNANIYKTGTGNLTLSGNLNITGQFNNIVNGTLIITGNISGAPSGMLVDRSAIVFNQVGDGNCAALIFGNGSLAHAGTGTLTLGPLNLSGPTSIASGTMVVQSGALLSGNINNNGTLAFSGNSASTLSGPLAGTGSLIVNSTATLLLTANNTYTGPTTISDGTLIVDGALPAASNVTVNSGGVLGGAGNVAGPITLNPGGGIAPGDNGNGTLTVPNLSLGSGTTANFAIANSGNYSRLSVTGALTYGGNLTLTLDNSLAAGSYTLFSAGSRSGDFDGVALTGLANGTLADSGGVWTGSTTSANFTLDLTSGQLTIAANFPSGTSPAKQSWLQSHFSIAQIADPDVSGDSATPSDDGVSNLVKYAFNLDPWTEGPVGLPQPVISGGNLVLVFTVPPADVTYTVEASTDLMNWSTDNVAISVNGNQVTATYPLPVSGRAFMHIVLAPQP